MYSSHCFSGRFAPKLTLIYNRIFTFITLSPLFLKEMVNFELKLLIFKLFCSKIAVAPLVGAWIEISLTS